MWRPAVKIIIGLEVSGLHRLRNGMLHRALRLLRKHKTCLKQLVLLLLSFATEKAYVLGIQPPFFLSPWTLHYMAYETWGYSTFYLKWYRNLPSPPRQVATASTNQITCNNDLKLFHATFFFFFRIPMVLLLSFRRVH